MSIFKKAILTIILLNSFQVFSQCINVTPYGSAIVNSCSNGTISTCNYASEYGEITFNTVGTFTFNSSISTDYLTLTTALDVVIASGPAPLVATIPSIGGYRLHVNTNSACGTSSVCRITTYACGAPTATVSGGCISSTAFGSANITSCTPGTITTCNYSGEYSELTIPTTGLFTFNSSFSFDYLTFTDNLNNVLYVGTTPLNVNITTPGNYRLHVSSSSLCPTDAVCRTTSYSCTPLVPCSGTPLSGTTTASSGTICGAQTVNFGLSGSTIALGLNYQWQSSPTGVTWSNLTTYTNSTMSLLVSSTTYYRCIIGCGTFTSSSVPKSVTVGGTPIGGTAIASSTTSCAGAIINMSLSGSSTWSGLSYQWQSSSTGVTWSNIAGAILPTRSQAVIASTYFRCILTCGTSTVASSPVYIFSSVPLTYASLPLYETFDNTWQNGCATRNVPNNLYWQGGPLTGNNAWRRQNDGSSAGWTSPGSGIATPHSGTGCANFHSSTASIHSRGDLDVLVNMGSVGKYAITFYYINPTGTDNLDVLLSTDAGISYSIKGSYNNQTSWAKKIIYYNSVGTPSCIVRFKGNGNTSSASMTDDIAIDSLAIRLVCLTPSISATASSTNICIGQSITLTGSGATNYTWTPGGITSSVAVVSPVANTNYVLTATNDGLCFPTTNITVSVTACPIGVTELSNQNAIIYPNPSNKIINVDFSSIQTNSSIELFNSIGELVLVEKLENKENVINIENLQSGIYIYRILTGKTPIKNGKLIKQ